MSSLRYQAVLFDLDGTLVNSGADIVRSVRHTLNQVFPGRGLPADDDILLLVGLPLESIVGALGYSADADAVRSFVDVYRSYYAEHYNDTTAVYAGVRELLEELALAGVRLGLVTTKHQQQAEFTLNGLGLARYFNHVHGWLDGRKHKPDPEPITATLRALSVEPASALMVGDSELDIQSAEAAGVDVCAVTYGFRPALLLRSFSPDFLVSHPADIAPIVITQSST